MFDDDDNHRLNGNHNPHSTPLGRWFWGALTTILGISALQITGINPFDYLKISNSEPQAGPLNSEISAKLDGVPYIPSTPLDESEVQIDKPVTAPGSQLNQPLEIEELNPLQIYRFASQNNAAIDQFANSIAFCAGLETYEGRAPLNCSSASSSKTPYPTTVVAKGGEFICPDGSSVQNKEVACNSQDPAKLWPAQQLEIHFYENQNDKNTGIAFLGRICNLSKIENINIAEAEIVDLNSLNCQDYPNHLEGVWPKDLDRPAPKPSDYLRGQEIPTI